MQFVISVNMPEETVPILLAFLKSVEDAHAHGMDRVIVYEVLGTRQEEIQFVNNSTLKPIRPSIASQSIFGGILISESESDV